MINRGIKLDAAGRNKADKLLEELLLGPEDNARCSAYEIIYLREEVARLDKFIEKREEYVDFLVKQNGELQFEVAELREKVEVAELFRIGF